MKTINAFAILLDGEVRRIRYTFKGMFAGFGYQIVKRGTPPNQWLSSDILYTFEPRWDSKGKYWFIHGQNRRAHFARHVRRFNFNHLVKLHATGILPQSIVL